MPPDAVIGLDSSTTSTKAIAWTRNGTLLAIGRHPIRRLPPTTPDSYEQDPAEWWQSAVAALRQLLDQIAPARIAALAISNQRETFVPLRADGQPLRPAIVWLDQRAKSDVATLAARIGADRIHRITGKPPDTGPVAYRLAWMARAEPHLYRSSATFADVHAYLAWRLTGAFRTSWASADPLGLFDLQSRAWSPEILSALDLTPAQLPALAAPGTVIGEVTAAAAAQTHLAPGTLVVAGGGDGQAAGLGVNALHPSRAYLNLGTAVVSGTYSPGYLTDPAWRTMGSCSGEGYYCETSLRSGTSLTNWFAQEICGAPGGDTAIFQRLEAQAAAVPIGSHGLFALPYWSAVMNPYWDPLARGCLIGLTAHHHAGHIYRALLEGVALEQALASTLIEERTGRPMEAFVAIGGGASSPLWTRIFADACNRTVLLSDTVEASSLGAAVCASVGAGWYPSAALAAQSMAGRIAQTLDPIPANAARYRDLFAIYRQLYPRLRDIFAALA